MNDKSKARRAAYEKRQEEKGRKIVNWIFAVLVILAVIFIVYSATIAG